jgi:uncharacterized damage-inducible protein DinB
MENMPLNKSISQRLKELFIDGHWITNTNYKELLTSIDKDVAIHKVSNLNTIAELTYHINYYLEGLNNVFGGGALEIRDKYSFDITPIHSEEDWRELVIKLITNAEHFIKHVDAMTEEKVLGPFIEEQYGTYLRNIEGVIEHGFYHLGQMVIIQKMMDTRQ